MKIDTALQTLERKTPHLRCETEYYIFILKMFYNRTYMIQEK